MLLLLARFILVLVVLALVVGIILYIAKSSTNPETNSKLVRNYEKRFDPSSNKYFIVNVLKNKEEPVCTWYGKRILYKDMVKAEYVLTKLNETK